MHNIDINWNMIKFNLLYLLDLRLVFNPLINYNSDNLGNYSGVNLTKRKSNIIVSITSNYDDFKNLPITIFSLLNQSLKPDRIILWIPSSKELNSLNDLPYDITKFLKYGLEVVFVKTLSYYNNFYYATQKYNESIIVLAEDNIYYSRYWLERLYFSYVANPNDIQVHKAYKVSSDMLQSIPRSVANINRKESVSFANFLDINSGVLLPPQCFISEALRADIFLTKALNSKDVWLWIMALLSNRKIRIVKNNITSLAHVDWLKKIRKNKFEVNIKDQEFKNLMKLYGSNVITKI